MGSIVVRQSARPSHGAPPEQLGYHRLSSEFVFAPSGSPVGRWAADKITGLSDGDPVGTWADESGNGIDLTQSTAGSKPTYKTNIQNGEPVVRFDGGDYLENTSFGSYSQTNTTFIVAAFTTISGSAYYFLFDGIAARSVFYIDPGTDTFRVNAGADLDSGVSDTNWHYHSVLFKGASSDFRIDGVSKVSGDGGTNAWEDMRLGCSNAGAYYLIGDIGEFIVYDGEESFTGNESGLASKWGL